MGLKIRPARIEDKEKILSVIGSDQYQWDKRIAKRYYDDYFTKNSICLKGDEVYVLTSDNIVIGVTGYSLDRYETGNYWLGWFYVHEKYRKKNHGTKLLKYIIKQLKNKGVKKLFVDTSSHGVYAGALVFYIKNGFRIEAVIRDYYEEGEDQIILSKGLI